MSIFFSPSFQHTQFNFFSYYHSLSFSISLLIFQSISFTQPLFIYLSPSISQPLSIYLSISRSQPLSVSSSLILSLSLSIYLYLSIYLSIYLYLSPYLSLSLSLCLSFSLSLSFYVSFYFFRSISFTQSLCLSIFFIFYFSGVVPLLIVSTTGDRNSDLDSNINGTKTSPSILNDESLYSVADFHGIDRNQIVTLECSSRAPMLSEETVNTFNQIVYDWIDDL